MKESLRKLYYFLSPEMRLFIRKVVYFPSDVLSRLVGGKDGSIQPSKGDIYTGSGDFIAQGQGHLRILTEYGELKPTDRVLDVGSGIGRTAIALTSYFEEGASYEGFDVVKKGVDWCQRNISSSYPNFTFRYVPLSNDLYNSSADSPLSFTFPYKENEFDLVFLFSVFTHLQLNEIQHYLKEISRVLKSEKICIFTCFTYNEHTAHTASTQDEFNFPYEGEGFRLMSDKVKSANIAIDYQSLLVLIDISGFELVRFIPGFWLSTQDKSVDTYFQDIVVLRAR